MLESLIQELDSPDSEERARIRQQLIELGTSAVEPLIAALQTGSTRLSWQAALVLADIPDPRWIEPMRSALTSHNFLLGQAAVSALEDTLTSGAVEMLLEAVPRSRPAVQIAIVAALERLNDRRSIEPLSQLLETSDVPELRYTIVQALGNMGDQSIIPLLRKYQSDPDHHVRERVEIALSQLGESRRGRV